MAARLEKNREWQITWVNLWPWNPWRPPEPELKPCCGHGCLNWRAVFGDDGALSEDLGVDSLVEDLVDEAGVALAADAHDFALEGMWNHFTCHDLLHENEKFRV